MLIYLFDNTFEGLLTAVFDAFFRKEAAKILHADGGVLLTEGDALPLFAEQIHEVETSSEKAQRVWSGLEKRLQKEELRLITMSWLSELRELNTPLFRYICKVFRASESNAKSITQNFSDEDVLQVSNIARRVGYEAHRMMQFVRFQKAKDGTYLGVVSPDHNVLPLVTDHFRDRFGDQPWLLYDAKRRYGYYYNGELINGEVTRVTFDGNEQFDLQTGKLNADLLSEDDTLFQDLWRTYFKAICIKERINPKKQLSDMPQRYWRYMTEKQ